MSRDRDKRRIPTSAELEERGEVSPPTTPGGGDRPGLLKRLLRAGRFRVSEDVAARKHVSAPPRPDFAGIGGGSPVTPDASVQANEQSASSTKDLAATPQQEEGPRSRKRAIRIDDSVKERRGLGRAMNKLDDV
jgi:hypothetical protein